MLSDTITRQHYENLIASGELKRPYAHLKQFRAETRARLRDRFSRNKTMDATFDYLVNCCENFGFAFFRNSRLLDGIIKKAKTTRSERSVQRATSKFVELGLFDKIHVVDEYGRNLFNLYVPKITDLLSPLNDAPDDTPDVTPGMSPPAAPEPPQPARDESTKSEPNHLSFESSEPIEPKNKKDINNYVVAHPSIPENLQPVFGQFAKPLQSELWQVTQIVFKGKNNIDPEIVFKALEITADNLRMGEIEKTPKKFYWGVLKNMFKRLTQGSVSNGPKTTDDYLRGFPKPQLSQEKQEIADKFRPLFEEDARRKHEKALEDAANPNLDLPF